LKTGETERMEEGSTQHAVLSALLEGDMVNSDNLTIQSVAEQSKMSSVERAELHIVERAAAEHESTKTGATSHHALLHADIFIGAYCIFF